MGVYFKKDFFSKRKVITGGNIRSKQLKEEVLNEESTVVPSTHFDDKPNFKPIVRDSVSNKYNNITPEVKIGGELFRNIDFTRKRSKKNDGVRLKV